MDEDAMIKKQMMLETGERLRLLRQMHGSDHELAEALGSNAASWSTWESGEVWLPLHFAGQIKKRYGCTIEWLYLGYEALCAPAFIEKLRQAGWREESEDGS